LLWWWDVITILRYRWERGRWNVLLVVCWRRVVVLSRIVGVINAKLAIHDFVVVEVAHSRGCGVWQMLDMRILEQAEGIHTRIWIFGEPKALRSTSLAIIDKAEIQYLAGRGEEAHDLFFGEAYKKA